jgi:beta-lactamase class A
VAAKSGALMGVVRNEIGVVTRPDGPACAVAVFTRTEHPGTDPRAVDAAIGAAAARAVAELDG